MAHVARSLGQELLLDRPLEDASDHLREVVDRLGAAARDVQDLAVHPVGRGGEQVRGDDVADVREVARLLAVAVDGDGLPGGDRADELGDDGRVLRVRVLAGAEDVEVAERHRLERVDAAEADAVALGGELRDAVRRDRIGVRGLHARELARVAVDRGGRREDDAADALVARRQQDVQRPLDVDGARRQRVLDGAGDGRKRAEVEDELDAAGRVVHALVAPQLALDDLDVVEPDEVAAVAGREVVEHAHLVAALEQAADEIGADEAGAPGDQNLHGSATTWKLAISDPVRGSLRSVERRSRAAAPRFSPATNARPSGARWRRRARRSA